MAEMTLIEAIRQGLDEELARDDRVFITGGLYHSQSVEAFFAHVPGLKVLVPSNPADAKGLIKSAVRDPNPVVFFEPKKGYRLIKGEVPEGEYTVPIGPAQVTRPGRDL